MKLTKHQMDELVSCASLPWKWLVPDSPSASAALVRKGLFQTKKAKGYPREYALTRAGKELALELSDVYRVRIHLTALENVVRSIQKRR